MFVKKAVFESMGRSIELVLFQDLETTPIAFFESLINQVPHIWEERIEQSEDIAAINGISVNTIRSIIFNTKYGMVVLYYFMKN